MDTFSKIRSGIGDLKKEKEDIKNRYQFLSGELGRIVETNARQIRDLSQRVMAQAQMLSAADARIRKMEEASRGAETRIEEQISSVSKQAGNHREALGEMGLRIQKAQSTAEEAIRENSAGREMKKSQSKSLEILQKRVNDLESLRERVNEIGSISDVLGKGLKNLEELKSEISGMQENISGLEVSMKGKADLLQSRLAPDISAVKNGIKSHGQEIERLQSALEKVAMEINGKIGRASCRERV